MTLFGFDISLQITSRRRKEIAHDIGTIAQRIADDCGHDYEVVEFLWILANELGYDPNLKPPAPKWTAVP